MFGAVTGVEHEVGSRIPLHIHTTWSDSQDNLNTLKCVLSADEIISKLNGIIEFV